MTIVFLVLFTLIFVTSLIGDIKSRQEGQMLADDQGQ
jgi:Na+-transporting methylmalonyl-CoA/oxaloacetate decarboxylase gamma subunit